MSGATIAPVGETVAQPGEAAAIPRGGHDFGRMRVFAAETADGESATQRADDLVRHKLPIGASSGADHFFESNARSFRAVVRVAPDIAVPASAAVVSGQRPRVLAGEESDAGPEHGESPVEQLLAAGAAPEPAALVEEPAEGETVRLPDIMLPQFASLEETDSLASTLTYNPTITQSGAQPGGFGTTRPYSFSMSGISVTRSAGTFTVTATVDNPITYQVRTSTGPSNQTDIDSATDSDITSSNYPTAVSDLTPDTSDLDGRPPRSSFWAKDLTIVHELFHATEGSGHARSGVTLAQNWLNGQTAGSAGAVNTLLGQVPARVIATRRAAMTYPGREERAYADGASLYQARADAIKARGDAGLY